MIIDGVSVTMMNNELSSSKDVKNSTTKYGSFGMSYQEYEGQRTTIHDAAA